MSNGTEGLTDKDSKERSTSVVATAVAKFQLHSGQNSTEL